VAGGDNWEEAGDDESNSMDHTSPLTYAVLPQAIIEELEPETRKRVQEVALRVRAVRPTIEEAGQIHTALQLAGSIRTGCAGIDDLLGGGLRAGTPLAVVGPGGSGKTQFAYHVVASSLMVDANRQAFWVDTTSTFRPERIHEMVSKRGGNPTDVLRRILVRRVVGSEAQQAAVRSLRMSRPRGSILVIDNVYTNFEMDYPGLERSMLRYAMLRMHLLDVADLTYRASLFTLVLFPVRYRPGEPHVTPAGQPPYLSMPSQLWLEREGDRRYATYSLSPGKRAAFKITDAGLVDA
jgi:DNA repair protein RadB